VSKSLLLLIKHEQHNYLSPVLWHRWFGVRKSMQPVKNRVIRCWNCYLSVARCRLFAHSPADATVIPFDLSVIANIRANESANTVRTISQARRRWQSTWAGTSSPATNLSRKMSQLKLRRLSPVTLLLLSDANDRLLVVCNLFDWLQSRVISDTTKQSEHF